MTRYRRIEGALGEMERLPTLPAALAQALETASAPDSSAVDLGKHIAADQSLAATLLRIVNSAYYGFPRTITSVTSAIVVLGFVEVRNLVMAASVLQGMPRGGALDRTQLWRHALAAAMAAERISRVFPGGGECGQYIAGLLHDIGKVALDVLYPGEMGDAYRAARECGLALRDVEGERLGVSHAQAGAALADHWNLPETIVEAIRCHHEMFRGREAPLLVQVTALADFVAYEAGMGDGLAAPERPLTPGLRIECKQLDAIVEQVQGACPRIDALLGGLSEVR